ncbi:cytosolic Fe-S cluster assembly factor nar1 [Aspergillus ambiguus]|uniref:iron-sulfur cluster assembly protein NAR1 n=1 Tax=Aspergillus ambiguus TaxID=176160 RepID=UPI003CCD9A1E
MSAIIPNNQLNDFITPNVACIKPVETLPPKQSQESENPYEVTTEDKVQPENPPTAQISLTDCLACAGCVTSAETVLISLQSHAEVLNTLDAHPELRLIQNEQGTFLDPSSIQDDEGRIFVASVSPQVRASLAATYGIPEKEAASMIHQLFSGPDGLRAGGKNCSGFTWVVDTNVTRDAVLALTADEVSRTVTSTANATDSSLPKKPILSSACPGWICYVEKTRPFVLPHLSKLKSPQALAGTLLKSALSKTLGVPASRIWHLAVMPCFDKKLEASREELTDASWNPAGGQESFQSQPPVRDVDCVITTREVLTLASSRGINLPSLISKPSSLSFPQFPDKALHNFLFSNRSLSTQSMTTGTSGGYLYHVLMSFQERNQGSEIVTQKGRNADMVEYVLMSPQREPIIKAARYYGFKNIQNLVRNLKPTGTSGAPDARSVPSRGKSVFEYAYVEVMACPGGCTNGGGQVQIDDARQANMSSQTPPAADSNRAAPKPSRHEQRAWLARVDEAYFSAGDSDDETESPSEYTSLPEKEAQIHQTLRYWSDLVSVPLSKLAYTTYREVESDVGKPQKGDNDTTPVVETALKTQW